MYFKTGLMHAVHHSVKQALPAGITDRNTLCVHYDMYACTVHLSYEQCESNRYDSTYIHIHALAASDMVL
jgi:hypothetical protein